MKKNSDFTLILCFLYYYNNFNALEGDLLRFLDGMGQQQGTARPL